VSFVTDQEPLWAAIVIRLAVAADKAALERLAELDSARPPEGRVVIGEVHGQAVAAMAVDEGRLIADPCMPTANLAELLRVRADQFRG
jgi:hypothetical protein